MVKEGTNKNWEADRVDVPSASVPQLIVKLYGGESITLLSKAGSGKTHYIGSSSSMSTTRSYALATGTTLTLTMPISFGRLNYIEIWALAEVAGEDICYVKLIDLYPSTEGS